MKPILIAVGILMMAGPALADDKPTPEQLTRIDEVLKSMNCEVDHDNVEVEKGVFDLDDVMCADGQYDMKLDASYNVTNRRKE